MAEDIVQEVTGESARGFAITAIGAILGGALVVPIVQRFVPGLGAPLAGILAGGAAAMIGSGMLKKAGQGLVLASGIALAGAFLAPLAAGAAGGRGAADAFGTVA